METINYFNDEPRFNVAFLRNNLPIIKDGSNVPNRDDKNVKGAHWFNYLLTKILL